MWKCFCVNMPAILKSLIYANSLEATRVVSGDAIHVYSRNSRLICWMEGFIEFTSQVLKRQKTWTLDEAGSCSAFYNLRSFIQKHARTSGSPVVCNGGSDPDNKLFTCIHNSKSRRQPESVRCPFGFTVKWDNIGYYVHLAKGQTEKLNPNGCRWHLCPAK